MGLKSIADDESDEAGTHGNSADNTEVAVAAIFRVA